MYPYPLRFGPTLFFAAGLLLAHPIFADSTAEAGNPATAAAVGGAADSNRVENSVVKIFATLRLPDPFHPWAKQSPREIRGSGVVIEGKRILTNAHMVVYASQVQIQANQSGDKVSATVEAVAPEIDLAVLKLDDETFFDTHAPLPRSAALPAVKDPVLVYGYPTGGTSLSITKGIVSRIEFAPYNYPVSGLRVQIDAAINPGNSGGPAVAGDQMVGIAFARLNGKAEARAEGIGYIIPNEEIEYFLHAVARGGHYRKPVLFDNFQTLENPALRAYLKLDKGVTGVIVTKPEEDEPDSPLKKWDVITRIGGTPVDDEGMVRLPGKPRLAFRYRVQAIAHDGTVPLTVVRGGHQLEVAAPVRTVRPMLIPDHPGAYPSYFIFGPLVFSTGSNQFMAAFSRNGSVMTALAAIGNPLVTRLGAVPAFPGEELVVVSSPFFPHRLSRGYSNPEASVVKSINGIPVKYLAHLVEFLRDSTDKFITVEFASRVAETLVFPRAEMVAATDDILSDNGIRSQGSPDTLAIWNAKPAAK